MFSLHLEDASPKSSLKRGGGVCFDIVGEELLSRKAVGNVDREQKRRRPLFLIRRSDSRCKVRSAGFVLPLSLLEYSITMIKQKQN